MISSASPGPSVKVFSFGKPFETGAFIQSPTTWTWSKDQLPSGCSVTPQEKKGFKIQLDLGARDSVVGLGQHVGPVNCRGNTFRLFSTDCPVHIPSLRSMYGAHPGYFSRLFPGYFSQRPRA